MLWLLRGLLALSVESLTEDCSISRNLAKPIQSLVRQAFAGNSGSGKCAELLRSLRQVFNVEKKQCCKTV